MQLSFKASMLQFTLIVGFFKSVCMFSSIVGCYAILLNSLKLLSLDNARHEIVLYC